MNGRHAGIHLLLAISIACMYNGDCLKINSNIFQVNKNGGLEPPKISLSSPETQKRHSIGGYLKNYFRHHSITPEFVKKYKENIKNLKISDPCIFDPCGANTHCVNDRHFTRLCHCNDGFIAHPRIPDTCVLPCLLQSCDHNAICINNNDGSFHCICEPGFLPEPHETTNFKGCLDPCTENPCNAANTFCVPENGFIYQCLCLSGNIAINGNAELNGCEKDPCIGLCDVQTEICFSGTCYCQDGFKYNGDSGICIIEPCLNDPTCGPNAACVEVEDFQKDCICKTGYFPVPSGSTEVEGCIDPCDSPPNCPPSTICVGLSATDKKCFCKDNFVPIDGNALDKGCEPACVTNLCGPNMKCKHNKCACLEGYFPVIVGNVITECKNPCDPPNPCTHEMTTRCIARSATAHECVCTGNLIPKMNNAELNGCEIDECTLDDFCASNEYCARSLGNAICLCLPPLYYNDVCNRGCVYHGLAVPEGIDVQLGDCTILTCTDGVISNVVPIEPKYAMSCYLPFRFVQGGCFYHETNDDKNFCNARKDCIARGGDLMSVNLDDNTYVENVVRDLGAAWPPAVWIGVASNAEGLPFIQFTVDGKPIFPIGSNLWESGQPNGDTETEVQTCLLAVDNGGRLNVQDRSCSDQEQYVCEIPNVNWLR